MNDHAQNMAQALLEGEQQRAAVRKAAAGLLNMTALAVLALTVLAFIAVL